MRQTTARKSAGANRFFRFRHLPRESHTDCALIPHATYRTIIRNLGNRLPNYG
jgi:hypothetical protein